MWVRKLIQKGIARLAFFRASIFKTAAVVFNVNGLLKGRHSGESRSPVIERDKSSSRDIDIQVATMWGKFQGVAERADKPMPAISSLIAATGITHQITVVTRESSGNTLASKLFSDKTIMAL